MPGRKSDIQECQWLLKLHAFGLLNNSFQPTDEIRIARTLSRQRSNLVTEAASVIQRMQKVLTEINVQLSNVLSDISGLSGMKIIGAILEGERDPWELAALVEPEVKATPEEIAKSLEGNWREELLFVLRQHVELYRIYQGSLSETEVARYQHKKAQLQEEIENLNRQIDELKTLLKQTPHHIPVKDLPEADRFSRLLTERKHLIDTIKLIAYRAECQHGLTTTRQVESGR